MDRRSLFGSLIGGIVGLFCRNGRDCDSKEAPLEALSGDVQTHRNYAICSEELVGYLMGLENRITKLEHIPITDGTLGEYAERTYKQEWKER